MRRYQEFKAWQLAAELNRKVFALTSTPPSGSDFRFRDNIRDAADSAQRNFPEGFGRFAPALAVGLDRGYFSKEDVDAATSLVTRALSALAGLQRYLRSPRAKLNAQRARAAHIARRATNPRT